MRTRLWGDLDSGIFYLAGAWFLRRERLGCRDGGDLLMIIPWGRFDSFCVFTCIRYMS